LKNRKGYTKKCGFSFISIIGIREPLEAISEVHASFLQLKKLNKS
jgi:hypothetical protein